MYLSAIKKMETESRIRKTCKVNRKYLSLPLMDNKSLNPCNDKIMNAIKLMKLRFNSGKGL